MAGPSLEKIMASLYERRRNQGPLIDAMRKIREAYNGDVIVPLPELDRNEMPAVINIVNTALDQTAMRIASVQPSVDVPILRPGIKTSEDRARTTRRAILSWWQMTSMQKKLRRRARHLIGYASSPVVIRPDAKRGAPCWYTRDPLTTFPCPTGDPDQIVPPDCIFTYQRSWRWLVETYPDAVAVLNTGVGFGKQPDPADRFDVVEYIDDQVTVLAVLGRNVNPQGFFDPMSTPGAPFAELERIPNRAGCPLAVVPGRITLDRPMGQYDGMIGMYQMMARLTALEVIAVERGIFPNTFLMSRPGETARFITGPHDGRTGLVNIVAGGDIKETTPNPGFATSQTIDRIERAARISGGAPSEYGGESPTNVRTGKRGDAVMSAIVDFPVQEAQEVLAESLVFENQIAIDMAKRYFGEARKSFYVSGKNPGHVDYVPNRDFETNQTSVAFPYAGADANALLIGLGQRLATGLMSARTAMEIDPMVADPELEKMRTTAEGLDRAINNAIDTQAAQGAIPPHDVARIKILVLQGVSLEDAVTQVQQEAQTRQATPASQPGAPETQPGIAQPGAGAEQPSPVQEPQGVDQFSMLMNALRRPQRENPSEQATRVA